MLTEEVVETTEYAVQVSGLGRPLYNTKWCPGVMLRRQLRGQTKQLYPPYESPIRLVIEHLPAIATCTREPLVKRE